MPLITPLLKTSSSKINKTTPQKKHPKQHNNKIGMENPE
jgi:hypothetical protein